MKGEPTMPNQEPMEKRSPFAKERRIGTAPAEALKLGEEIEKDLTAVETLTDFYSTAEYQAFEPYMNEPESEAKAKARQAAKERLQDLTQRVGEMNENLQRIQNFWQEQVKR